MRVAVNFKNVVSLDGGAGRHGGPPCPEGRNVEDLGGRAVGLPTSALAERCPLVDVVASKWRRVLRELRLLLDGRLLVDKQAVHVVVNGVSKGLINGWDLVLIVDESGRLGNGRQTLSGGVIVVDGEGRCRSALVAPGPRVHLLQRLQLLGQLLLLLLLKLLVPQVAPALGYPVLASEDEGHGRLVAGLGHGDGEGASHRGDLGRSLGRQDRAEARRRGEGLHRGTKVGVHVRRHGWRLRGARQPVGGGARLGEQVLVVDLIVGDDAELADGLRRRRLQGLGPREGAGVDLRTLNGGSAEGLAVGVGNDAAVARAEIVQDLVEGGEADDAAQGVAGSGQGALAGVHVHALHDDLIRVLRHGREDVEQGLPVTGEVEEQGILLGRRGEGVPGEQDVQQADADGPDVGLSRRVPSAG